MRSAGVCIRKLLSMAREEFIKSCKLMNQIKATVTAIILIWSRRTIFIFTLTAYLWIISRSKISLELMISTREANLTCLELPGFPREIWENLAMRGHLQSVQKELCILKYITWILSDSNFCIIIINWSVKHFSSTYKNTLLQNMINDDNYQINNCFDKFYSIPTNAIWFNDWISRIPQ